MRSIEPGIHNPDRWLWIPGLRPRAHPRCPIAHRGMRTLGFACRPPRHCERSEAIQLRELWHDGLLRCARNDGDNMFARGCLKLESEKFTAVVPHKRSAMRDP